jgi:hypothetical protein
LSAAQLAVAPIEDQAGEEQQEAEAERKALSKGDRQKQEVSSP